MLWALLAAITILRVTVILFNLATYLLRERYTPGVPFLTVLFEISVKKGIKKAQQVYTSYTFLHILFCIRAFFV